MDTVEVRRRVAEATEGRIGVHPRWEGAQCQGLRQPDEGVLLHRREDVGRTTASHNFHMAKTRKSEVEPEWKTVSTVPGKRP